MTGFCGPAVLFVALLVLASHAPCSAKNDDAAVELLKQAAGAKSAAERIAILDKILSNQSLRGETLSRVFLERGKAYKKTKDYYRAIEDLSSALAHSRKALPALLEKAECLIMVNQPDEASADVEHYLTIRAGDANAYVLRGMIYEKQGFLGKAEDEYTRALYYDKESVKALSCRAKVRLKSGQTRSALEDADQLCKLSPKDPDVFALRARIFVKLKEHAEALTDFTRAQSLAPGDDRLVRDKCLVYLQTGRPEKALETLSRDLRSARDDVPNLVLRARAHILLGDYDEAERSLKQAVEIAPEHAEAYLYFGVAAMHRKLMDEALGYFNRALALDRNLVEAYKERARTFIRLGDNVRAACDLSEAADLDPADAEIFSMRGLTNMNRMLYDAAVKDFTSALHNLPSDPGILFDRAVAHHHGDDQESALSDLDRVVLARPDSARGRSFRGVVRFHLGDEAMAREDLEEATRINARDAQVWNNLGFFRYKTGDQRGAMDALNRALQLYPEYDTAGYNLKLVLRKEEAAITPATISRVNDPQEVTLDKSDSVNGQ
ncbi:MAG: tetratricopeptide repeat protein [Pseudomonadota bacterium]